MSYEQTVFRRASTTFFWSSLFFAPVLRRDVTQLYAFVRLADDFVDSTPPQPAAFHALRAAHHAARRGGSLTHTHYLSPMQRVAQAMAALEQRYRFDPAWTDTFLDTMQSDLTAQHFRTLADTRQYMYGSAEVIGEMLARVMHVPAIGRRAARAQGRAMQYLNFIRDIAEDTARGRCYFADATLAAFGLADVTEVTARAHPTAFRALMRAQITQYRAWQQEATAGYCYLPHGARRAVSTAADMHQWTAGHIAHDPFIVFSTKVKPHPLRVAGTGLGNYFLK